MLEVATGRKISLKKFLDFAAGPEVVSAWCLSETEDLRKLYTEKKLVIIEAYDPISHETLGVIAFFIFPSIVSRSDWNTIKRFAYSLKRELSTACFRKTSFSAGILAAVISNEIAHFLILDVYDKIKVMGLDVFVTDDKSLEEIGFIPTPTDNGETVYTLPISEIKK